MNVILLLLTIVIWGFIFWLLWWGLAKIGLGEPFNKLATIVLVIAAILVVVGILMGTIAPFPILTTLLH